MDNNVDFISSIKQENDFEELIRRFVQKIFDADAYLVGGPYDGGRDIVYSKRGRETREELQISIQEKNLESKIDDDLRKVVRLVDEHSYPSIMYLKQKKLKGANYNFFNFLEELIGYEDFPGNNQQRFNSLLLCSQKFLEMSGVKLISERHYEDDSLLDEVVRKYWQITGKSRKRQTIKNDLIACQILGDSGLHCDDQGVGQTPMLITWDSTQHDLRNAFRQKNRYAEWLIYTPQRAIERLSMIDMKIQSSALKDGVLAIIDEDFFKDSRSSLIDTLGIFLGEDTVEAGEVISLLTKLTRRITEEAHDPNHIIELDSYNILNEVLIYTQREFKSDFINIRKLFADERFRVEIFELLRKAISTEFDDEAKAQYITKLLGLLESSEI